MDAVLDHPDSLRDPMLHFLEFGSDGGMPDEAAIRRRLISRVYSSQNSRNIAGSMSWLRRDSVSDASREGHCHPHRRSACGSPSAAPSLPASSVKCPVSVKATVARCHNARLIFVRSDPYADDEKRMTAGGNSSSSRCLTTGRLFLILCVSDMNRRRRWLGSVAARV